MEFTNEWITCENLEWLLYMIEFAQPVPFIYYIPCIIVKTTSEINCTVGIRKEEQIIFYYYCVQHKCDVGRKLRTCIRIQITSFKYPCL